MMSKYELCTILLKWLQTFNLDASHKTLNDICDGVAMAQVLNRIDPEYFSDNWLSKIKTDVGDNWRLRVSNLKKLIERITDYYQECLNQPLTTFGKPDAGKIGEHRDAAELVKLVQLILGCAVNCDEKQEYIKKIMQLEESVQSVIMQSIQELERLLGSTQLSISDSLNAIDHDPQIQQLVNELRMVTEAKDEITQKCSELTTQINLLQDEKILLIEDKKQLEERLRDTADDPVKNNVVTRKQLDTLKEDIFKLETSRDDYRLKYELQEKELLDLQSKYDSLQQTAVEARNLKDEIDVLRENADKVEKLESTIHSYKKKFEEMSELKREIKLLENKNLTYIQQIMELEEESKKANTWKTQVEVYKKQISELRGNLNEQSKQINKMEFENMKIQEKLNALQKEKERLIMERDSLKEAHEDLMCSKLQLKSNDTASDINTNERKSNPITQGLMSIAELNRELVRLQHENRLLKINQKESDDGNIPILQITLDDLKQENKQIKSECKQANQRILELEAELKEVTEGGQDLKLKEVQNQLHLERNQRICELAEKERALLEQKHYASVLQETINEKDQEIQELEERHKKYVEKARSVAKSLDTSQLLTSCPDISNMLEKSSQNQEMMEDMEKRYEQMKTLKDTESKLMATAFYNLSVKKQRESVDQRLSVASTSSGNSSFLTKQRQSAIRRTPLTYTSK